MQQRERVGEHQLRAHEGPDVARVLRLERSGARRHPWHPGLSGSSAYSTELARSLPACLTGRTRSAGASSPAPGFRSTGRTRRASRSPSGGPTSCWTSSRPAARSGVAACTIAIFSYASDLDYVRGRHSFRVGLQVDGGRYRTDTSTNYLGTYTFESLEAFNEGRPRSYTQRVGDPDGGVLECADGAVHPGRLPSAQEPLAELRPALRDSDARGRPGQHRSARRPDVVAVQVRPHDACVAVGASSTTGSRWAPTRRCCSPTARTSRR